MLRPSQNPEAKALPAMILLGLALAGLPACSGKTAAPGTSDAAGTIVPRLFFEGRTDAEAYAFLGPRDMTIDRTGALFIFDYDDYVIKKYDREGRHLATFGGTGDEPGRFMHLTNIRAVGDRLLAVDSTALNCFSLDGGFLERTPFPKEVLCDHPAVLDDGGFVGSQIVAAELKKALTLRGPDGTERARLASYDLRDVFPELQEGEDFFLGENQSRQYCYTVEADGAILWASSDDFRIYRYRDGASREVLAEKFTAAAFPKEARLALEGKKSKAGPPFFLNVPRNYQLVHHLLAGPDGDLWVYLKSLERTGFLRYSARGRFLGWYALDPPFEMTGPDLVVRIFADRIYFFVAERRKPLAIYVAEVPGRP